MLIQPLFIGTWEIIAIVELMEVLGKGVKSFKKGVREIENEVKEIDQEDSKKD